MQDIVRPFLRSVAFGSSSESREVLFEPCQRMALPKWNLRRVTFCCYGASEVAFALVLSKIWFPVRKQIDRMKILRDADIEEMFSRSSGPGGQHVNKVSTAVTLRHVPTGLSVTVSDSRSQAMNRETARRRLLQKITEAAEAKKLAQLAEASRERRRKAKRSRGTKAKLVESKRRRSETKKMRGKVA